MSTIPTLTRQLGTLISLVLSVTLSSIPSFAASSIFDDAFLDDKTVGTGGQPLLATAEVLAGGVSGLAAVADYRSDKFYDLSNRRRAELYSLVTQGPKPE